MSKIDAYPLCWPVGWKRTPSMQRAYGQFKGTLDQVRRELLQEVDALVLGKQARTLTIRNWVVISTDMPVRRDGEIMASAREPQDPGVAVYFKHKDRDVCFACDKYDRVWKNLRAVALTIGAMRGIERWGSAELMDRTFTGFAALPPPRDESLWQVLGIDSSRAGTISEAEIMEAWRLKAKGAHPDVAGGSHEAMAALNTAKDNALATVRKREGSL